MGVANTVTINESQLPVKTNKQTKILNDWARCYSRSSTVQDMFLPIPGLISGAG